MKAPHLKPDEQRALRAQAHHLDPVVMIGNDGLTPAVLHEIDVNLLAHGLIKIRVFSDDRAVRAELLTRIAAELDAAPVQHIGKLLVVYRPVPEPEHQPPAAENRRKAGRPPQREARGRAPRGSAREPAPDPRAPHVRRNRSRTPVVIEARRTAEPVASSAPVSRRKAPGPRTAVAPSAAGRSSSDRRSGAPAGKRPAGIPGRRRRTGA